MSKALRVQQVTSINPSSLIISERIDLRPIVTIYQHKGPLQITNSRNLRRKFNISLTLKHTGLWFPLTVQSSSSHISFDMGSTGQVS